MADPGRVALLPPTASADPAHRLGMTAPTLTANSAPPPALQARVPTRDPLAALLLIVFVLLAPLEFLLTLLVTWTALLALLLALVLLLHRALDAKTTLLATTTL